MHDTGYIATCSGDPADPKCWKVEGPFLQNISNGGGGMLVRNSPPHYMFSIFFFFFHILGFTISYFSFYDFFSKLFL